MTREKLKIIIGALLHDIGKVIYRQGGDLRKHSVSGYTFLKDEARITDKEILESVRYHHSSELKGASISDDSYAYLTWISDNIASSADRRKAENEDTGFEKTHPLTPVFNVLNGNSNNLYYHKGFMGDDKGINYPTGEKEVFDDIFYNKVKTNLLDNLHAMVWNDEYINSLLAIIEANLAFVPSSTAKDELSDISLYDHMKLTAAISSCIYDYLEDKGITDYKTVLFNNSTVFYEEKNFLLFSMDVSGIQNFIYTIHSKGALKTLRARSFYLEIMMEHIVDELLNRLELSRANLIYSGGGHCYILIPNTQRVKQIVSDYEQELNQWLLKMFDISLYVGSGYTECSAKDLRNEPSGAYADIYKRIGNMISEKKAKRYTVQQIISLNNANHEDYSRECKVCRRLDQLSEDDICSVCSAIINFSKDVMEAEFFTIINKQEDNALPLPFDYYMIADTKESVIRRMESDENYIRTYSKNTMYTGKHISTKIWIADYKVKEKTFEELAECSEGIKRIGILRADVDNLGKTFVSGFENDRNGDKYVSLSRTATLSRHLSC